ncbi:MAG: alpha/beta hydrolase, partial [Lachnospiraceae bacterium]|nr:alpha/beta hydrolase [Lachnospiraceae bacterium]
MAKIVLLIVIAAIVICLIVIGLFARKEAKKEFGTRNTETSGFFDYFFQKNPDLSFRRINIMSDKARLGGIVMEPQGTAKALIVMTHGYGRTLEHYLPECACFVRSGYEVLAFDGTGTGMSEGSGLKGLPQHTIDMAHVLDHVEKDPDLCRLPLLLYGHSWGGYAANAVSCFKKYPLKGLISVAAYNDSLAIMLPS